MRHSLLLSKYTFLAILPYFGFVWVLLSVILFVQQGSRYSELIFDAMLPDFLIWQLTFALIPNVVAFTGPVALLVGVVIGLSRMQGDSEVTAMRAAGVGNSQIVWPVILLGVLLSVFALFINIKGIPFASQIVRQVALEAALYKLQSPVDPGVFNTEIENLTIFVRTGDVKSGKWKQIFILQKNADQTTSRLITASEGFVATKEDKSEIVLENARIATFGSGPKKTYAMENVGNIRLQIETKRAEIIERLEQGEKAPEEMGLNELARYWYSSEGAEQIEAYLLWQRRLVLSFTPLVFALLGAGLVAKFNRGSRGFGIFLALTSLAGYYLVTLLGEQLGRTGMISIFLSGVIPLFLSGLLILWLFYSRRVNISEIHVFSKLLGYFSGSDSGGGETVVKRSKARSILDYDIVSTVLRNYLLTLGFLVVMYMVFTAFELWKFAGTIPNGVPLLAQYLLFLLPFIYVQIAPSALMVAAIATFVIKTRQNEVVTWTSAGRSVYRILMPCFVLALVLGAFNLSIQEVVLNRANRTQDQLREQIRSRNEVLKRSAGYWMSSGNLIISFEKSLASDNENTINNVQIYRFHEDSSALHSVVSGDSAVWDGNTIRFPDPAREYLLLGSGEESKGRLRYELDMGVSPFAADVVKSSHLNISETLVKLDSATSDEDIRKYSVSLHKKYTAPFLPLVIVLLTAPFALSIHSKGNVVTIGYAAGLWLFFIGLNVVFEQFGQSGFLSPALAVWSPLVIFGLIGLVLLSRIRT